MIKIELKNRQREILEIVKKNEPITSENIANLLELSRSAIRSDLSILIMAGLLEAKPKVGYFYVEENERQRLQDYFKNVKVKDILSMPVVINEKASVYDGIVTMFLEDVGTIFVTSDDHLIGVVSRKDFLKTCIGSNDIHKMPVGIIMTRMPNIVVTFPDEPIVEAARKIIEHQIDSLPVVEKKIIEDVEYYKVKGRISKTNITRQFVELCV